MSQNGYGLLAGWLISLIRQFIGSLTYYRDEHYVYRHLGKRGCISDRHPVAGEDLMVKRHAALEMMRRRHASWDEAALSAQWHLHGYVNYCPLIGIPHPSHLHVADALLQKYITTSMGIRRIGARANCLALVSVGGLQLTSLVESTVAAVARDSIVAMNGDSAMSTVARRVLRQAMNERPLFLATLKSIRRHRQNHGTCAGCAARIV